MQPTTAPGVALADRDCHERKGEPPLTADAADRLGAEVPDWHRRGKVLSRELDLKDFSRAIDAIDRIARTAEEQQHHPDLHLTGYRKLRIDLTTHSVGGLSENDYILAAKIDRTLSHG